MEITIKTTNEDFAKDILETLKGICDTKCENEGYGYTLRWEEKDDEEKSCKKKVKEYIFEKDFDYGNGIEDFDDDDEEDVDDVEEIQDEPEKRFGAGFEIDEPRACDYEYRGDFLYAHELFDKFVEAGEACVEAGLERKGCGPITKINAIKKEVGDIPPIGVELMGETQWECK